MTDPIADMLSRIRNATRAFLPSVEMPYSKIKESIANTLKQEGYVADVTVEGQAVKKLKIKLKYDGKRGAIEGIRRVSRPGIRRYAGAVDMPRVLAGLGITIVSTSEGVMTGMQAKKKNVGGELLCQVW